MIYTNPENSSLMGSTLAVPIVAGIIAFIFLPHEIDAARAGASPESTRVPHERQE
jgi:hypothetical protein